MGKRSFNSLFLKKIKVLLIKHSSEITLSLPSIIHSFCYLLNVYICQPAFLSFPWMFTLVLYKLRAILCAKMWKREHANVTKYLCDRINYFKTVVLIWLWNFLVFLQWRRFQKVSSLPASFCGVLFWLWNHFLSNWVAKLVSIKILHVPRFIFLHKCTFLTPKQNQPKPSR